ncbi:MAG TPA: tyrosine-type recombinase/integrase [Terriglobales bacterium]|nr:tyrosine-type recombinase/integrase [Terriglobales bacterium]
MSLAPTIATSHDHESTTRPVSNTIPSTVLEALDLLKTRGCDRLPSLFSKLTLVASLLNKLPEDVSLGDLSDIKPNLRSLLEARHLAENSIRTYVYEIRFILQWARKLGWAYSLSVPAAWAAIWTASKEQNCLRVATDMIKLCADPRQVTAEHLNEWIVKYVVSGHSLQAGRHRARKLRLILTEGFATQECPSASDEAANVNVPDEFRTEVLRIIRWKTASYAPHRSKDEQIREVTAEHIERTFYSLYRYSQAILRMPISTSISELITFQVLDRYIDWRINEQGILGQTLISRLSGIKGALRHPDYRHLLEPWLDELSKGIPTETEDVLAEKRIAKQVPYELAETIPLKVNSERRNAARKSPKELALTIRNELIMKWLVVLPWRSRNIRECRIHGDRPNLFKAPINPAAAVSKPDWAQAILDTNPNAEFWQCRFSASETKAKRAVHFLLPRPLIPLLEEYLGHRPILLNSWPANTLFVNTFGNPMTSESLSNEVGELSIRYLQKLVTPHTFRHIVAYGWLKEHPTDYLTVSKLLFHRKLETTIRIYASRFNESDGACGMERWLESRQRA